MYKYLLCWRYLLTRYLALACIVSVMLGVATLIVVNSVMSGFSTKLKDRLHGILADVLIESRSSDGTPDPQGKMRKILASPIGDLIEAMTPTMEVFAMIQFRIPTQDPFHDEVITRGVRLIGVDPASQSRVDGFANYLEKQKGNAEPSFELGEEARRRQAWLHPPRLEPIPARQLVNGIPEPDPPPSQEQVTHGIFVGHTIAHFRTTDPTDEKKTKEYCMLPIGEDVIITTISGQRLKPVYDRFAVCDYFKSEMSEYDSNYVFVPLAHLQKLRTMEDRVTSIQIKLKNYKDADKVVKELKQMFPNEFYEVSTWEHKQGALLAAIAVERGLLNVLLFLIICVAGFGILAIFAMIVVEKTRDIGILKALGASNLGVMQIFMGYGLLLGLVGAGLGTGFGVLFTNNINRIEGWLSFVTGQQIFPRGIYYFDQIPTDIQPMSVLTVNLGAVGIAVLFSIFPALRAAMLHPVRALRYE